MKISIIYTRVSTDKQTCESQLNELREYCARKGLQNVREITDQISGSKFTRDGLDELMTLVRSNKVESVLCFRLDRLGRSLPHLVSILSEFLAHSTAFIVPSQGIDTSVSNPLAQLQLNMLMAFAQFERELIRERVIAGVRNAQSKGVKFGPPRTLDQHRDKIIQLSSEGIGPREIARRLNISPAGVCKIKKGMAA